MKRSLNRKQTLLVVVSLALVYVICALSFAEVLMPKTGKQTKKNGSLVIDVSNMSEGYVMAKGPKTKKKLKLVVKNGKHQLQYDLNGSGNYEVIPLQYGNGKYSFSLFQNTSGKKYSEAGKVSISAKMKDPNRAFLYPNQYVNYTAQTAAVIKAAELCKGVTDQAEIAKIICNFVHKSFAYDYLKANSVKKNDTKGMMPAIDETWKKHMGVCQDLSAITVCMLRSQGVPAKLMIGDRKNVYHAWVSVILNGEEKRYDPTAELEGKKYKKTDYTLERFY